MVCSITLPPRTGTGNHTCGLAGASGKTRNGTRVQRVEVPQFSAKIQLRRVLSLGGNRCEQDSEGRGQEYWERKKLIHKCLEDPRVQLRKKRRAGWQEGAE